MIFPQMHHVRQVFDAPEITRIEEEMDRGFDSLDLPHRVKKGSKVAITAGSRGIAHIDRILRHLVQVLKGCGAHPFLIPSMGSHGGGTAEGQLEILKSLHITETSVGAPIVSSMEVVEVGRSRFGFPVWVDRHAAEADGVIVINRIKPHTEFEGPIESGLMKMMAIGMGNHKGCFEVHKQTVRFGYREVIPEIGGIILERLPILFGVGIVENIYDKTAMIRVFPPKKFMEQERSLLIEAKRLMARLPFDEIDILIVDEMGKNISGTGMDTNVVGRIMFIGEREPERPKITRIIVLDLTEQAHGNAVGIGLADYTTRELVGKIDFTALATNAITAMTPEKGRIPIALETDRAAVEAAFKTIGDVDPEEARVVHIKNTLEMGELHISRALLEEAKGRKDLKLLKGLGALSFDGSGKIRPVQMG
jgi:hypothetical protein